LKKEEVQQFAKEVKLNLGNVDMLINNAGQGRVSNFENTQCGSGCNASNEFTLVIEAFADCFKSSRKARTGCKTLHALHC
jgi:short-subunit dehydrogenase